MGKKRIITSENEKAETGESSSPKPKKSSIKKQVFKGLVNISASYNNTIVSVADMNGKVFAWSSAGTLGFKGTRKSTPYAATLVGRDAVEKAKKFGFQEAKVSVRGIGPGREAAIRGISATGINITAITDDTPIPHNGVRPPKPRRV